MKRLVNSEYESIILLKENTDECFCFYNENMDLLVGPLKHPKVEYIDDASCYIFENRGEIVTGVYYILEENGKCECRNKLEEKNLGIYVGFAKYTTTNNVRNVFWSRNDKSEEHKVYWFGITDGKTYSVYSYELECIAENAPKVVCFENQNSAGQLTGVLYVVVYDENDIPTKLYTQEYFINNHKLTRAREITDFEYVCEGIGNDKVVVKNINRLYFFSEDGKINFSTFGRGCVVDYAEKLTDGSKKIYIVRNYKNELTIFLNEHNRVF